MGYQTERKAAYLAVVFAARSGFRQKTVNWESVLVWQFAASESTLITFMSPLPSNSKMSMCRQLCEMGGGIDDVHCCATHSREVLKQGNSWSQQSVHHFICRHQDERLDSRWDPGDASISSVSVAVWLCSFIVVTASYERSLLSN